MSDPYIDALDQLAAYGLQVDALVADGKLRRVKAEGDRGSKKSGWYVAHEFTLDSGRTVITGRFGNWKLGDEAQQFRFDAKFTPEERAAFAEKQAAQRKAAEAEKRKRQQDAARRAAEIWPKLPESGSSEYLARKKIHGFGCRYSRGAVVVPLYRGDGELVGLQFIDGDGSKRFLTGTAKQGAWFYIPGTGRPLLCEGYATGCSLAMATGRPVAVAFDAGNMLDAARRLDELDDGFTVAADNDHGKECNKGLETAALVLQRHEGADAAWPEPETGVTDFNDIHVAHGLDAVLARVNAATRDIPRALLSAPEAPPPPDEPPAVGADDPPDDDWLARLKRSDKMAVLPLSSNIALILEHDERWRGCLSYCDFSYRVIKRHAPLPDMQAGEWEDADTARLLVWLSDTYGFEPARNKAQDAIIVAAQRARYHPVRDYLESLNWDGTERIDYWLEDIYESTAGGDYLSAVGSKFLIGAVARIMRPGCKMDNVMILEGRQGLRKSTSLAVLFGDWFSDAPIPIGDKDAYQNIQGVWCSELAELDSFNKAESTSAKLFFSQVRDRYRPSYGHTAQDFPRQTVFVGTTNQSEYLKDYTGNRRYWPVYCTTVKLGNLKENRDQLWAEAYHRYRAGESWWPDDDTREIFEDEQDSRMQVDPWQYPIEDYLAQLTAEYCTATDILKEAIGKDQAQITRADQNRISPIMRKIGWKNIKKRIQIGAKKVPRHVYVRADR